MKKLILFLSITMVITVTIYAQAPQAFKYQAIARDEAGNVLSVWDLNLRVSLIQEGTDGQTVYTETHKVQTNIYGLINLIIGEGDIVNGDFSSIKWSENRHYIKTEMDIDGGEDYREVGTSQLYAVPYALYAEQAGKIAENEGGTATSQSHPVKSKSSANNSGGNRNGTPNTKFPANDDSYMNANIGSVGIGTTDPQESAILELNASNKGFLPPRMTGAERDAISSPADGLVIFNTTSNCLNFYAAGYWIETCGIADAPTVTNPTTSETWMDRNLGASQVATSSTDATAYGDLYQWGRATEGHEVRTSGTTSTNATTAIPNDGNVWDGLFITEDSSPNDWLTPQDNTLWQGAGGTNNPCPNGFRLPTEAEWEAERLSWSSNNAAGAYGSPLKLTVGGYHNAYDGSLNYVGSDGDYWSSSISGTHARNLAFSSSFATMNSGNRAYGFSVRCIKD